MLLALSNQTFASSVVDNSPEIEDTDSHSAAADSDQVKNSVIAITIGKSRDHFCIEKLSHLSYFEARLSSRWLKNKSKSHKEIEILGSNGRNENASNCSFNPIQFNFTCNDLKTLLACVEASKIPEYLCLELNELE